MTDHRSAYLSNDINRIAEKTHAVFTFRLTKIAWNMEARMNGHLSEAVVHETWHTV